MFGSGRSIAAHDRLSSIRRSPRKKIATVGTAVAGVGAAVALFATPALAVLSGVSPTVDATTGLPDYYQDSTGLALTACTDGTAACAGVTPGPFAADTTGTAEVFYNLAVSSITGPKIGGAKTASKLTQTLTLQGGHDASNQPITFQRIRTKIVGGAANATYSVVEPFGTQTIATNATGTGTTTQDIGCAIGANLPPCDFTIALAAGFAAPTGSVGPFIQWDVGAPAGYVGDGVLPHTIKGSTTGNNFFSMTGPGLPSGNVATSGTVTSNQYVVTGKIAVTGTVPPPPGPAVGLSAAALAFGNQALGTRSAAQSVTVTNTGSANLVVSTAAISSGDFVKTADTCSGATVAAGATCSVSVAFAPPAGGTISARSASLVLTDNAAPATQTVALSGSAIGAPGISVSPSPLAFGSNSLLFGGAGVSKTITVTSNGSVPLVIGAATIGGTTPADYTITANGCSGTTKAPGATCTITVKFRTKASSGTFNATLSLASNVATSPTVVAMSGTGSF